MVRHMGQKKWTLLSFCSWSLEPIPLARGTAAPGKRLHRISIPLPGAGELLAKSSQAMLSRKGMKKRASKVDQTIPCRISGRTFIISSAEILSSLIGDPGEIIINDRQIICQDHHKSRQTQETGPSFFRPWLFGFPVRASCSPQSKWGSRFAIARGGAGSTSHRRCSS